MSDENIPSAGTANVNLTGVAAQIAAAVADGGGHGGAGKAAQKPSLADLLRLTREQLLGFSKSLNLAGVSKLPKPELAARLHSALGAAPAAPTTKIHAVTNGGGATSASANDAPTGFPPKFDLGPDAEEPPMPRNIPWGYGHDRVTAMVVDPDRLFVYWEVTDEAMARARRELGKGGAGAWLSLRVYDITGRLFDGTNAHSYFDHKLERNDRQWFFDINKPTS